MPGHVKPRPARDVTIDVARGIAIILVVVGHNHAVSTAAPGFIAALFLFHVPLFFALSGLVQREQPLGTSVLTLARRLLVPFFVAAFAVGIVKCVTRGQPLAEMLSGVAWGTGQTLPWSHLWFLPALFVTLLALQALRRIPAPPALRWLGVAAVSAVALIVLPFATGPELPGFTPPVGWPWSLDLLAACLTFAALGAWLGGAPAARALLARPWVALIAAAVFAACVSARVDLNLREFSPPLLALGAALSGCAVALAIAAWLARGAAAPALALVGRHTLVIFLLHVSLQKLLTGFVPSTLPAPGRILLGLAAAAVTILVTLALSLLWERVTRRMGSAAPPRSRDSALSREVST